MDKYDHQGIGETLTDDNEESSLVALVFIWSHSGAMTTHSEEAPGG